MRGVHPIIVALGAATVAAVAMTEPASRPVGNSQLAHSDEWQRITAFWQNSQPIATTHKSTQAQRAKFDREKLLAEEQLATLVKRELISKAEQALVQGEFDRLRDEVYLNAPTDMMVMCYAPRPMEPPGAASLKRLARQAELLEKKAESRKLSPQAIALLRGTMQKDLDDVKRACEAKQMRPEDQAAAPEIIKRIEALLTPTKP